LLASAPAASDHVPDSELLRRFVASNDPAAFELIVRRHADAVWAAAFHILKTEADADDAFQAAFLALIRKAKQIRTACVGGWLYRVAVHAALKLLIGR
jgi:DNA-directed RNA polymerase specialized sigma24 family protein